MSAYCRLCSCMFWHSLPQGHVSGPHSILSILFKQLLPQLVPP